MRYVRTRGGFTLLELLVVIGILVLLAGAAVPMYLNKVKESKVKFTDSEVRGNLAQALDHFKLAMDRYPTEAEGLKALQSKPDGDGYDRWSQQMDADKKLVDAWGKEYKYFCDDKGLKGEHNTDKYDLSSAGPDGEFSTDDDIVNWTEEKK